MSIERKIRKYLGHQVNVELDDGRSINGVLKGDSGVANAIPDVIYISNNDLSDPLKIPVDIITDINLI